MTAAMQKRFRNIGTAAQQASRSLFGLTVPIAAIGTISTKSFLDFESSFAGVRKTVEASEPFFQQLSDSIRQMAKEIPISVNELNTGNYVRDQS